MSLPPAEPMPVILRAYAPVAPTAGGEPRVGPSDWTLVFDCETTEDTVHSLRFGAYRVHRGDALQRSGFFYDPDQLNKPDEITLRETAAEDCMEVLTFEEFGEDVFFRYAYDLGGLCVGFNLPFDLSRLAVGHVVSASKDAFSLELSSSTARPRVRIKHRGPSAAKIEFVSGQRRRTSDHAGHFLDLRTLGRALTGSPHSLKSLARALGTKHRKRDAEHGEYLTPKYVRYCANDVQVTRDCFEAMHDRYASYALTQTPVTNVMSEAGIGKGALREMGIRPWREVQPDFPPGTIGQIMSGYYGGRSEIRERLNPVEVIYCDFLSMYPTSCANMGLWRYVVGQGIDTYDATGKTREFLANLTVDQLQDPKTWREFVVMVEVAPDGDRFPVRAQYRGETPQPEGRPAADPPPGIALNYLSSSTGESLWFTKADCAASTLLTGKPPRVIRAIGFQPRAPQPGLMPLNTAGNPDYRVDPYTDDYYRRLIELRTDTKKRAKQAKQRGEHGLGERLDGEQQGIKTCANGSSYGCFIELNPETASKPITQAIFAADGAFPATVNQREKPGRYFHPLLATVITGAARLKLAIAEHLAYQQGLDWAFCDTDSISFTNPRSLSPAEFHARVEAIREWFLPLNPYQGGGHLLKLEDENYALDRHGELTGELRQLVCVAVSPKRYVLFNIDSRGRPILRKASAHGLGHLLPPYKTRDSPRNIPPPAIPLRELDVQRWQYDIWYRIAHAALEERDVNLNTLPALDRPAMASYTITTPAVEAWFETHNQRLPYRASIRPFGFLNSPTIGGIGTPLGKANQPFRLIAPYTGDPEKWAEQTYTDIHSGEQFRISPERFDKRTATVRTYRQTIESYLRHPDPKRLGPDGQPCARNTIGKLRPRHIDAFHLEHTGKEAGQLDETEHLDPNAATHVRYRDETRDPFHRWIRLVLHDIGPTTISKRTGLSSSAVTEIVAGRSRPHQRNKQRLTGLAERHAAHELGRARALAPKNQLARIYAYLSLEVAPPGCATCGAEIASRSTYCSAACRQKAYVSRCGATTPTPEAND